MEPLQSRVLYVTFLPQLTDMPPASGGPATTTTATTTTTSTSTHLEPEGVILYRPMEVKGRITFHPVILQDVFATPVNASTQGMPVPNTTANTGSLPPSSSALGSSASPPSSSPSGNMPVDGDVGSQASGALSPSEPLLPRRPSSSRTDRLQHLGADTNPPPLVLPADQHAPTLAPRARSPTVNTLERTERALMDTGKAWKENPSFSEVSPTPTPTATPIVTSTAPIVVLPSSSLKVKARICHSVLHVDSSDRDFVFDTCLLRSVHQRDISVWNRSAVPLLFSLSSTGLL